MKENQRKNRLSDLFNEFFENEKSSAIVLILCTIVSLFLANSIFAKDYFDFWNIQFANHSMAHWVNDGLMTIFFLLIGLELEREIYQGELSDKKTALLPIFAAMGGMIVPAIIYLLCNFGTNTQSGMGIPMATDIAFALGVLSLLGKKVPISLKIFLTALAVIDDLGAIMIIALFYTKTLVLSNLITSLCLFLLLLLLNRLKIRNLVPYLFIGVFMWYFMLKSGVHATVSGILLAFAIPFGNGDKKSTSYVLQHFLHKPVAFFILPTFALANTAISINPSIQDTLSQNYSLGIILGLLIGKPLGIFLFSFLAVSIGICKLPNELNWKTILGAGFLGGIGFTMSIFITLLAFNDPSIINNAKWDILLASIFSAIIGFVILKNVLNKIKIHN